MIKKNCANTQSNDASASFHSTFQWDTVWSFHSKVEKKKTSLQNSIIYVHTSELREKEFHFSQAKSWSLRIICKEIIIYEFNDSNSTQNPESLSYWATFEWLLSAMSVCGGRRVRKGGEKLRFASNWKFQICQMNGWLEEFRHETQLSLEMTDFSTVVLVSVNSFCLLKILFLLRGWQRSRKTLLATQFEASTLLFVQWRNL